MCGQDVFLCLLCMDMGNVGVDTTMNMNKLVWSMSVVSMNTRVRFVGTGTGDFYVGTCKCVRM